IAQNEKRAAEKAAREQAAKDAAWSEWAADHTDVVEFLNGYTGQFGFLEDMAALAADRDPLTERQVAAVRKCMVREQERAAKQAAREAARNATPDPAPEGRVTVEGEIVRVTSEPSRYSYHGTDDKMIVDCGHFSVWVTVPSNLVGQLHEDGMIRAGDFWELKGRRVRLTATLTRSDRDPKFAFGKRPRAQLLDIRPASENQ